MTLEKTGVAQNRTAADKFARICPSGPIRFLSIDVLKSPSSQHPQAFRVRLAGIIIKRL